MTAATKNDFQDYDPRHRLTGAVVLILLAIILLPMLLTKKTDDQPVVSAPVVMEVTKEGKKVFVSRISSVPAVKQPVPVKAKPVEEKSSTEEEKTSANEETTSVLFKPSKHSSSKKSAASTAKPASKSASKPATKKSSAKTATKTATKTTSKTTTKTSKSSSASTAKKSTAAVASGSWIVQIGVFSEVANAKKKVSELKKKGFNAKYGKVKTSKGMANKVWIGPFKDRTSAEKMQDRLQHKTRQRGMVVKK